MTDPVCTDLVTTLASRVCAVPEFLNSAIEEDGLRASSTGELNTLMAQAQCWLGQVPELEHLVLHLVRDIHPLAAEPGYDISHSQPQWRERIFVSCPERSDDVGALRLAESVVHEAMHLHLTNEERQTPLVIMPTGLTHSPWRDTNRPVQGVMHGLFVFACIHQFLQTLTTTAPLADGVHRYIAERLDTISKEVKQIDTKELCLSLTPRGQAGVASWVKRGCSEYVGVSSNCRLDYSVQLPHSLAPSCHSFMRSVPAAR